MSEQTIDRSESQATDQQLATRRSADLAGIDVRGRGTSKNIMAVIKSRSDALALLAGRYLTPERLITMIAGQLTRVPHLAECTPMSVLTCAMNAVELGLPFQLGNAYLVPYKNNKAGGIYECQLIVGYRGYITLAYRHSKIVIDADVVREGDEFRYRMGLNPDLHHVAKCENPKPDGSDVTHAWAIAQIPGARPKVLVLTRSQILAARARSRASSSGPWVTDFPAMAQKTAIRRIWKTLPLDTATEAALAGTKTRESLVEVGVDIGEIPVAINDTDDPGEVESGNGDAAEPVGTRAEQIMAGLGGPAPAPGDAEAKAKVAESAKRAKKGEQQQTLGGV